MHMIVQKDNALSEFNTTFEPKTTLAEQLRKLRLAKGHMTARGFAKALGISENRYSRYERGEAVPKLDLVLAICDVLQITPNELYGWEPQDSPVGVPPYTAGASARHGFAESGPSSSTSIGDDRAEAPSQLELAVWRLASVLTSAIKGPRGLSAGASSQLGSMRATAELFLQLRRDPLDGLARILQSSDMTKLPADTEATIAVEIRAFLVALGSRDPASQRPEKLK